MSLVLTRCLRQQRLLCWGRSFSSGQAADCTHAIVGGGVVGLAIARQLAARPNTSTILIERHESIGMETSSRNSEVIHAGLYYPANSLKSSLCIRGRELLYSLCLKHSIAHRNTRKWIVAQTPSQWDDCLQLHSHAQSISVPTRPITLEEGKRQEPDVQARVGILESGTTGIVDSHSLMTFLQGDFEERGGDCAFVTAVTRIEALNDGKNGFQIFTRDGNRGEETSFIAETLINSAGLSACHINNMVLPSSRHRTPYYAKGSYFAYASSRPKPSILIYPAPEPRLGGLGTHLTVDIGGRVRFGPDIEWVDDPSDLTPRSNRLEEAIRAVLSYLPSVDRKAMAPDYSGMRPKLGPQGSGFHDFVIQTEEGFPGFVNLLGIESPGLTASLAVAEMVEDLLYRR